MRSQTTRRGGTSAYGWWILKKLSLQADGSAYISDVYDFVWENMREQFSSHEKARRGSIDFVWKNETRDQRENLINDGRMKESRILGLWEISERGRAWLFDHPQPLRLGEGGLTEDDAF